MKSNILVSTFKKIIPTNNATVIVQIIIQDYSEDISKNHPIISRGKTGITPMLSENGL